MTNSPPPASPGPRRPSDRLLHLAVAFVGIGVLAVIGIFATPLVTDGRPGLWLYLLAMLVPVGFLLALGYALWSGRRAR